VLPLHPDLCALALGAINTPNRQDCLLLWWQQSFCVRWRSKSPLLRQTHHFQAGKLSFIQERYAPSREGIMPSLTVRNTLVDHNDRLRSGCARTIDHDHVEHLSKRRRDTGGTQRAITEALAGIQVYCEGLSCATVYRLNAFPYTANVDPAHSWSGKLYNQHSAGDNGSLRGRLAHGIRSWAHCSMAHQGGKQKRVLSNSLVAGSRDRLAFDWQHAVYPSYRNEGRCTSLALRRHLQLQQKTSVLKKIE